MFWVFTKVLLFFFISSVVINQVLSAQSLDAGGKHVGFKSFNKGKTEDSSAYKELLAAQFALQSFALKLRNILVRREAHNYAVSLIVLSDNNKTHYHVLAKKYTRLQSNIL